MDSTEQPLHRNPDYLWGHLLATRALLFVFGEMAASRPDLREEGKAALQRLRDSLLDTPTPEAVLVAIDDAQRILVQRMGASPV